MRETCLYSQAIILRPASVANIAASNYNYVATAQQTQPLYYCHYYSSTTAQSLAYTSYSPCYISGITAPTFNSTSTSTPTVTLKTPVLAARCSATYFATAEKANVDAANSTVKLVGYLYRVKKGTSIHRQE